MISGEHLQDHWSSGYYMLGGNLGSLLYGDVSMMFKSERVFNIRIIADKENASLVSSGDREISTRGSTVPVGNEASPSFALERWTRGLRFPGSTVHQ